MSQKKEEETIWCQNQIFILQFFHRKAIRNRNEKKTETPMNKPVYLRLSILEFSKTLMHKFWYNYVKPKYGIKQSCVM